MSYILDALNKSEQERRSNKAPDLTTIHRQPPPKTPNQSSHVRWLSGLTIIVILNAAGYWWLIRDEQTPVPVTAPAHAQADNIVPASSFPTGSAVPIEPQPTEILISPGDVITSYLTPVDISGLPGELQSQIPDLQITSHLYSKDADLRMVNINGKIVLEGGNISDGMRLIEITEQGIVVNFQGYNFILNVLQDWHFE